MPEVYGFTAEQIGRVVAAVETVEGQRPTQTAAAPRPRPQAAPLHHVKVTSTTLSSGFYPGTIQLYDASTQTWSDGAAVNFLSSNGDAPTLNRLYLARAVGIYASNGKPIYARDVVAAGGGGGIAIQNGAGTTLATGVTAIRADASGVMTWFSFANNSPASVQFSFATQTQPGIVSTNTASTQVLGDGDKRFMGHVEYGKELHFFPYYNNTDNLTTYTHAKIYGSGEGNNLVGLNITSDCGTISLNRNGSLNQKYLNVTGIDYVNVDATYRCYDQLVSFLKPDGTTGFMTFKKGWLYSVT